MRFKKTEKPFSSFIGKTENAMQVKRRVAVATAADGQTQNATAIENSNIGSEINFATRLLVLFTFRSLHHNFNRTTSDFPSLFYRKNSIELAPIFNRLNGNAKSSVLHHNFPRWSAGLNGIGERGSGRRREFCQTETKFLGIYPNSFPKIRKRFIVSLQEMMTRTTSTMPTTMVAQRTQNIRLPKMT